MFASFPVFYVYNIYYLHGFRLLRSEKPEGNHSVCFLTSNGKYVMHIQNKN